MHLKDFADYCMSDRAPAGWFELLTERNTLFIKEYIKSNQRHDQTHCVCQGWAEAHGF
ncbi:TPA: replication protein [Streptococcus suis]|nr:replication protein [Streptococcus suis]